MRSLYFSIILSLLPTICSAAPHPLLSANLNVTALDSTSSRILTTSFLTESGNILITLSKRITIFARKSYSYWSHGLDNFTFGQAFSNDSPSSISLYKAEKLLSIFHSILFRAVRKTSTGTEQTFSFPRKRVANSSLILLSASCESSSSSSSKSPPASASNSTSTVSPVLSPVSMEPCSCPLLLPFDCASGPLSFLLSK